VDDRYEASRRQRTNRRRARVVAVVLALALLLPIVVGTISAVSR